MKASLLTSVSYLTPRIFSMAWSTTWSSCFCVVAEALMGIFLFSDSFGFTQALSGAEVVFSWVVVREKQPSPSSQKTNFRSHTCIPHGVLHLAPLKLHLSGDAHPFDSPTSTFLWEILLELTPIVESYNNGLGFWSHVVEAIFTRDVPSYLPKVAIAASNI